MPTPLEEELEITNSLGGRMDLSFLPTLSVAISFVNVMGNVARAASWPEGSSTNAKAIW